MRYHLQRWSRRWKFAPIRLSPVCHHHRLQELEDGPSAYPLVGVGWLVGMSSWWQDGERSASAGTVPGSVVLCGSGGRPHLQPTHNAPRRVSHIFQANYMKNRLAMGLWCNILFIKGTVAHAHAMKIYRGKSCWAPLILKLGTICRRLMYFKLRQLQTREIIWWIESRVGPTTGLEILDKKKYLVPSGIWYLNRPSRFNIF